MKTSEIISSVAEELAGDESDENIQFYIERLSDLAEDQVNLNSTSEDELSRLFFLTAFQVKSLLDYTRTTGKIVSVYEIASIPGFDRETASLMLPFITLDETPARSSFFGPLRNTLLTNITYRSGTEDTTSPGSPVRFLSKYRIVTGRFSGGFTLEKDPGEKLFTGDPVHPEFLSSFLSYNGSGHIKKIIMGDFAARFGQGTGINTNYGFGLPLTAPNYLAARNEIRQYTSTDENNFFRGAAAEFSFGKLSASLYWSSKKIDAALAGEGDHIESFYTSGLHNTETGMLRKDVVKNISFGFNTAYNFKNLRIGLLSSEEQLSLPMIKDAGDPEENYDFRGKSSSQYSVYYSGFIKKILLFGELSFNSSLNHAFVQGLSMRLSDRLTINGFFRSFEPGYYSLHGRGPGSSSSSWNERSMLANFSFEAARHLFVSGGCDFRSYPWLRYGCSAPSSSLRQEIRIRYLPAENLTAEVLYNHRSAVYDVPESFAIPVQEELLTDYARGSVRYSPAERLTLTTRIDYKTVNHGDEKGVLLLQDVQFVFRKIPMTCWFRYCVFSTDSWDTRLYTYENDLLYSFSIPALSGEGSRSYLMVKWEFGDFAEIRVKYGIMGNPEPDPVVKEDFRFQARLFF